MTSWEAPEPGSKIRVSIQENGYLFASDAVAFYLGVRHDTQHGAIVRFTSEGQFRLDSYDGQVVENPTMTMPREFAFALYRAMCQHFGDADESGTIRNLRSDMAAERKRVDTMMGALITFSNRLLDN